MSGVVPNVALVPPGPAAAPPVTGPGATGPGAPVTGPSFADVLTRSTTGAAGAKAPTFSRHALERVSRRGIQLDPQTLQRLAGGMSRAAGKGARDAVVFVDNTAFVVSVPNNTVVTAVGSEHMREHVFTNIDSAVIA
ncbi:MAG TPA: TIGR02530 family flagellar biosynthesis protein [Solirubrobacteraceae bacterium]|nr:TIGR02530 family flagellar biosynthesis protein [Solirubrobacteraceae bacterium]